MARSYKQGKFIPKNKEKYVGDVNSITYRSSWELSYLRHLDESATVVQYNSEEFIIPYFYPVDNKMHRYFVDMAVTYKQKDGQPDKSFLVEIKPADQTVPPKEPKRKTKKAMNGYHNRILEWEKNKAKWAAAREYCKKNNMTFVILTEKELYGKG